MAVNGDGVLVSGADNGTMHFWDWTTGTIVLLVDITVDSTMFFPSRLQLPTRPGPRPARLPRLRGWRVRDDFRHVRLEADHLRGRQDHQGKV